MRNFYLFILVALVLLLCYSNYRRSQQRKKIMKIGQIKEWLDQGPVILLDQCRIPDPVSLKDKEVYMNNPRAWPSEVGWTIKILETNEILEVHEETLS
tara:strand:- start:1332 stop:1625 length:294 start_codon:yes stop_codon:yes gene_type:complete